jgi:Amidases related to nicotinamidase
VLWREEAFESRRVIDRINTVAGAARNAGVPVVIIQHEEENGSLEYNSEGWKLDPDLDTGPDDIYVRKTAPTRFTTQTCWTFSKRAGSSSS